MISHYAHLDFESVKLSKYSSAAIIATFVFMPEKKTIMVAALHWGLGHATRCIPVVRELLERDFNVLLASDGAALMLLQKEFPQLEAIELPSYNIRYPKNRFFFKLKIILQLPRIIKVISLEKQIVAQLVAENKIHALISDNRFGVRNQKIPSVFITHQLNVLTGSTSFFSSKIHLRIIKRFDACWVPDRDDPVNNLSGKLGHLKKNILPVKYIGILSRMQKRDIPKTIDILILISGPEPQRTALEEMLKPLFKNSKKRVLMIRGIVEANQKNESFGSIEMVNYMTSMELEETINKSELVICRSGYSSIMDLTVLGKKVFFLPTPGQYEQEYLAKHLSKLGVAPFCQQKDFEVEALNKTMVYKGLKTLKPTKVDYTELFALFKGK